jgi:Doubled CXXCH motif (Paired_CXXCH_1)
MNRLRFTGLALLACVGCGDGENLEPRAASQPDAGDPVETEQCLTCHAAEKAAWQNPSSHRALFACTSCHSLVSDTPGPGHAALPACSDCHSELPHKATCTSCHDQHGSENAFLIRTKITRPDGMTSDVHLTAPEGESPGGLVHSGTGLCETCHTHTAHYLASGQGSPHFTAHCTQCHDHQAGFAKP